MTRRRVLLFGAVAGALGTWRAADAQQLTTFGLVLNQGTARASGLSLPRPLLLRAEEVAE